MDVRRKLPPVLLLLLCVALFRWLSGPDQVGRFYASLESLQQTQLQGGYLPIGYFGDSWPAVVIGARQDDDGIHFTHQNTPHSYAGFDGYRLKVVRLKGLGGEVTVVFRSVSPRGDSASEASPVRRL